MATPEKRSETEVTLAELANHVASARDVESLTRPMLALMERVTGLESTYLTSIDTTASIQRVLFSQCAENLNIPEGLEVPWGDTLCKRALTEGEYFVNNVAERWGDSEAARVLGISTYMSQPVTLKDGDVWGTLCAASSLRREVNTATMNVVGLFANIIGQQIDRETLFEKLVTTNSRLLTSASIDPLTGIANRRAFTEQLQAMLHSSDTGVQVAFIDLDGFKDINDRYGHDTGDRFLIEMSLRLLKAVRRGDLVARLGGDEFVVATANGDGPGLRERLEQHSSGEFKLGLVRFDYAGPSIGVINAADSKDVKTVIARADEAMYVVKQRRKQRR